MSALEATDGSQGRADELNYDSAKLEAQMNAPVTGMLRIKLRVNKHPVASRAGNSAMRIAGNLASLWEDAPPLVLKKWEKTNIKVTAVPSASGTED